MTASERQALVNTVPFWWHSIDVGDGIVTNGRKVLQQMQGEWQSYRVPDLHGKTVLDINTWDGGFAFLAESNGAASVTALDSYVWSLDVPGIHQYIEECKYQGIVAEQPHKTHFWKPDLLPGKAG